MAEGLFCPHELTLPPGVRAALPAAVRVYTSIRFRVTVYPTQAEVEAARAAPDAFDVAYLTPGGVAWPFHISVPELQALRANSLAAMQPGRFEVLQATRHVELLSLTSPLSLQTPELAGSASGVLVGHHGDRALIATNSHVAREAIGRARRTQGQWDFAPVPTWDLRVGVSHDGHTTYRVTEDVHLVANASHQDWKRGLDWALLSVPQALVAGIQPLECAAAPGVGTEVWALGFPVRSRRLETPGYENAEDTFRVSTGELTRPEPEEGVCGWRADLDGLSGSSGSAVVDAQGHLVGLFRNHTHYHLPETGPVDRRFVEFGGEAQVVPAEAFLEVLERHRVSPGVERRPARG